MNKTATFLFTATRHIFNGKYIGGMRLFMMGLTIIGYGKCGSIYHDIRTHLPDQSPDGRMIIDIRLNETGITLRLNIFMQGASCQFIPTTQGQMLQDASACKAVCSNYQRFHQNEYINTPNIR